MLFFTVTCIIKEKVEGSKDFFLLFIKLILFYILGKKKPLAPMQLMCSHGHYSQYTKLKEHKN